MVKNKICLIPDLASAYSVKMMADLSFGLRQIGYDAHHHTSPVEDEMLNGFVEKNGFNTVFRINKLPPEETKRSNNFRHITWFQDIFPSLEINDAIFQQDDLVCTLGSKDTLGLNIKDRRYAGSLNLFINPDDFSHIKPKYGKQQYDANLIGFIPNVPWAYKLDGVVKEKISIFKILYYHKIYLKRLSNILLKAEFEKLTFKKIRHALGIMYQGVFTFDFNASQFFKVVTKKIKDLTFEKLYYHKLYLKRLFIILLNAEFEKLTFKKIRHALGNMYMSKFTFDFNAIQFFKPDIDIQIGQKVEREYDILGGKLDINELYLSLEEMFGKDIIQQNIGHVDFCVRELPRFLDRYVMALAVSKVTKNLIICGNNWELNDIFNPFVHGSVTMEESYNIFRNSKLTLQNNNHGIGVHSRTLSAMASGGFVFTHTSPRDELPGGMKTIFEPGVHYGSFDLENITEETQRWLSSDRERDEIAERARQYVLSEMHWVNGATQFAKMVDL